MTDPINLTEEIPTEPIPTDTLTELTVLADQLTIERKVKTDYDEGLKKTNSRIADLETKMTEIMQNADIQKFSHGNQLFYVYVSSYPAVNKEKEQEFFEWLENNGEDGILKMTVNSQTLRAWYKEKAEQYSEELTEKSLVNVFEKIRIGVRKT